MPNTKPITALCKYSDLLIQISNGSSVILTRNGRCQYAILDNQEYENIKASLDLMSELSKGRKSGEEKGWLTSEDVKLHFKKHITD